MLILTLTHADKHPRTPSDVLEPALVGRLNEACSSQVLGICTVAAGLLSLEYYRNVLQINFPAAGGYYLLLTRSNGLASTFKPIIASRIAGFNLPGRWLQYDR
ncbi:hypothetical protein BAUCODRAFT_407103 [Baudoinia panamericana UAMH 10762]|uniref:Uncharacterized protein n=1 Tax=Baudoinia panamericana (strain UAMH 10762) TaxID=717646 RepID=M2NF71_BAUPA|nr:uncharacterized protein BAUCODRAFT_407103 [Baudoinia panamericana UAMH 10762]EMC97899.1 hypothetical protein BAUCODRAFT_407103 [Baudoinia panamericana UAMH 10762]